MSTQTRRKVDIPSRSRTKDAVGYYHGDTSDTNKYYGVYVGIVKNTQDAMHMGRIRVFCRDFGGDEDNSALWKTVSYCAPFGGSTPGMERFWKEGVDMYDFTPTSYGFWAVPPDVGNKVLVMFINGDEKNGIWIGSLYDNFMNFSVPGLASSDLHDGCDYYPQMPTTEYNKNDQANVSPHIPVVRPYHKRQFERMSVTAALEDPYRGWTTSSASRETPSAVYGMSTPGSVDQDAEGWERTYKRAGGHQFVMDDGDKDGNNRLIRLRARGGAQLLIHDTLGFVYICNKMGTAWVELDRNGNIDVFSNNTISLRSNEDINMRADRDFNIDIGRDLNLHMPADYATNVDRVEQKDDPETFKYSKISGLKSEVPDGSIVYHVKEGEVHGTIDKGNAYHTMGDGHFFHLLENGSYYRTVKRGNFEAITGHDYKALTHADMQHIAKDNMALVAFSRLSTRGFKEMNISSLATMHLSADDSIAITSGTDMHRKAGGIITDCATTIHHNDGNCQAAISKAPVTGTFAAWPAEKPKLQEFEDMMLYKPCVGPETEKFERRLTRFPTLEPWGGLKGAAGMGTKYHIDELTTGLDGFVLGPNPEEIPIPVDELNAPYRAGDIHPTVMDVPSAPVDGSPRAGMRRGQYVAEKRDANGETVWKQVGDSAAKSASTADLDGPGVDMMKDAEGLHTSTYKDDFGNEMIGYGHKINKEKVEETLKTEIKPEDTKIKMDTSKFPPFGHGRAESIPEIIKWAGKTATHLIDVTRGCNGTLPRLHKKGGKFIFEGEDYSLGITKRQADLLFDNDIKISIDLVRKNVKVDINQNQSNALISLARNLGPAGFAASTVLSALNKGNFAQATTEFMRYASTMKTVPFTLNGIESTKSMLALNSGLFSRRLREATLFSTPASELLRRAVKTAVTAWDPTGCGTYSAPRTPETWINPNTGLQATPGSTWIDPNTGRPVVAQHGTTTSGITGVSLASADQSLYNSYQNELPTSPSGYYRSTGSPSLVEQAYAQWDAMTPAEQAASSKAAQDRRKKAEENR